MKPPDAARDAIADAPRSVPIVAASFVLALGSQLAAPARPWVSLCGFGLAMLAFAYATRQPGGDSPAAPAPPLAPGTAFWLFFSGGVVSCALAAVAVLRHAPATVSHSLWSVGLGSFIVAAVRAHAPATDDDGDFWRGALALAVLVALAACIFGWQLGAIPVEVHGDDAEVGLDAIALLERFNLFSTGWFQLPRLHALPAAISIRLLGVDLVALRMPCVVMGTASVLLLFAVGRRLWSTRVGLIAALLLASQRFFIHLSRAGYHYVETPLASLLAVWLLLRLVQDRRYGAALGCGVVLGLGVQTYYATRLVPALLVATYLLWSFSSDRTRPWARFGALAVIVVAALATAAPMLAYFSTHWSELWMRTLDTSIFSPAAREHLSFGYGTTNLARILWIQARAGFGLFNATPDTSLQYGYEQPLLDPLSAALFPLGVAVALAGARRGRHQLLLLWIFLPVFVGAVLTVDSPFYPRVSGAVPFIMLAVAVALDRLLVALEATFPGRTGRTAALAVAAVAVACIGAYNLRSYFVRYAPHHRHSPAVEMSRWVRANGAGKTTNLVGGAPRFFMHHGAVRFLTWGYDTRDVVDLEARLREAPFDPNTDVFLVMPGAEELIPRLMDAVGPLRIEKHRNERGVVFLSAVPQASEPPAPDGSETVSAGTAWGPKARAVLAFVFAVAVLATSILIVGLRPWRSRGPTIPKTTPPRELEERGGRLARLSRRLAGPDARESRFEPPRWLALVLLAAIVVLAGWLRFDRLTELPPGFYCDEAGLGYNATSILRTGYDENGTFLPLYVWSFGVSYKNPVFVYSSMLPIALLGPTEKAVRLTSAVYGLATVLALFFLGRAVMGTWAGLFAAGLLAVCPWHLHFSRIAFELIAFPFFAAVGATCLIRFDQGRRTLVPAMLCLAVAVYTYAPAKLFVPMLLAGWVFVSHRVLRARWREAAFAGVVLLVALLPVIVFDLTHRDLAGAYFRRTSILSLDEPPLALVRRFLANYATFLSPDFLFWEGGDRVLRHGVRHHGELYPFFAPFLLLGFVVTLVRRDRAMAVPLLWVALYPIAPALMNEIPSASRGFIGSAGLSLLAAIGAAAVVRLPTQVFDRRGVVLAAQLALVVAGGAALLPQVRGYWRLYTEEYPLYAAKFYTGFQYGNGEAVHYFREHEGEYDKMVLTLRKSNQTDVFLRFYDGLARPPRRGTMPPFEHAEDMRVGWPDALDQYRGHRRILFAMRPEEVAILKDATVHGTVVAPDGSPAFVFADAEAVQDFVHTWRVTGPFDPEELGPPPDVDPEAMRGTGPDGRRWRLYRKRFASVGLNDFFSTDADFSCAWAVNFVTSDEPREATVWAGFDDTGEIWVNGERVELDFVGDDEDAFADAWAGDFELRAGRNTVAVWTCDERGDWRFYFRLAAPDDQPLDGLSWEFHDRTDGR